MFLDDQFSGIDIFSGGVMSRSDFEGFSARMFGGPTPLIRDEALYSPLGYNIIIVV